MVEKIQPDYENWNIHNIENVNLHRNLYLNSTWTWNVTIYVLFEKEFNYMYGDNEMKIC